jgi:hypothetical protein
MHLQRGTHGTDVHFVNLVVRARRFLAAGPELGLRRGP